MSSTPGTNLMTQTTGRMTQSMGNGRAAQSQSGVAASIVFNQPSRPMLAREADAMYWMSRYVERAEHVARILWVHAHLLTDVGELAPRLIEQQWQSVLQTFRLTGGLPPGDAPVATRVATYMSFGFDNHSSLINCVTKARDNARGIRESISAEMWEQLNTLYWFIKSDEARTRFDEAPDEFFRHVMGASLLFQGVTDQTLNHDQRWHFTQLGKYFERVDVTCRIIATRYEVLQTVEALLETPLRNVLWMGVLRSCCAIEHYRRSYFGDLDPIRVASFLLLTRDFPRTVRYCVDKAHASIAAIRAETRANSIDPAERVLGRLEALLEYAEPSEIVTAGLSAYLQTIQDQIAHSASAVQRAYFLY